MARQSPQRKRLRLCSSLPRFEQPQAQTEGQSGKEHLIRITVSIDQTQSGEGTKKKLVRLSVTNPQQSSDLPYRSNRLDLHSFPTPIIRPEPDEALSSMQSVVDSLSSAIAEVNSAINSNCKDYEIRPSAIPSVQNINRLSTKSKLVIKGRSMSVDDLGRLAGSPFNVQKHCQQSKILVNPAVHVESVVQQNSPQLRQQYHTSSKQVQKVYPNGTKPSTITIQTQREKNPPMMSPLKLKQKQLQQRFDLTVPTKFEMIHRMIPSNGSGKQPNFHSIPTICTKSTNQELLSSRRTRFDGARQPNYP